MECIINRQDQEEKINSMTEDMIGTIIHPGKDKIMMMTKSFKNFEI